MTIRMGSEDGAAPVGLEDLDTIRLDSHGRVGFPDLAGWLRRGA